MPLPSRLHSSACTCGAHSGRRLFLRASAALAAAPLLPGAAWAQQRSAGRGAIRSLRGLVRVNGERVNTSAPVRLGDTVATGGDGRVSFVLGGDAFFLRENSELKIETGAGAALLDSLRMVSGALGAVFARRPSGQVVLRTPTVTAGIRGTGCYTEVRDEGVYFCTCFGAIQLDSANAGPSELVVSSHHDPRRIMRDAANNMSMVPDSFGRHTDQEMDALERLVGRRAPWVR